MKLVLDTHAAAWNFAGALPQTTARRLADKTGNDLAISDVTLTELARLIVSGRINVEGDPQLWLTAFAAAHTIVPVSPQIAWRAASYDFAHRDPVDRHILATADALRLPLVTVDRELTRAAVTAGVRVVW